MKWRNFFNDFLDKNYLSIVIINNFTAIFPSIQILSFTTELLHPKFHHLQATNCSHNEQSGKIIAKNVMIQFFRNVWMRSKCREYHRWEDYSREYWLQYRYSKIECCTNFRLHIIRLSNLGAYVHEGLQSELEDLDGSPVSIQSNSRRVPTNQAISALFWNFYTKNQEPHSIEKYLETHISRTWWLSKFRKWWLENNFTESWKILNLDSS